MHSQDRPRAWRSWRLLGEAEARISGQAAANMLVCTALLCRSEGSELIVDLFQKKPAGRGCLARCFSVLGGKDGNH